MYFLTFTQTLVYLVKSVYSVYSDVLVIIYVHCIYTYILCTNHYISIYTFDYILPDNIPRVYCVHMYFLIFAQTLVYLVKSVYSDSVYSDGLII
jgi:hypothetical protein